MIIFRCNNRNLPRWRAALVVAGALALLTGCKKVQADPTAAAAAAAKAGATEIDTAITSKPAETVPGLKDCAAAEKEEGPIQFRLCWVENVATKDEYLEEILVKAKTYVGTPNDNFFEGSEVSRLKSLVESQSRWRAFTASHCEFVSNQDGWGGAWVSHAEKVCWSDALDERIALLQNYTHAPEE